MNAIEVEAALAAGTIDARFHRRLLGCLVEASRLSRSQPALAEMIDRAAILQHAAPAGGAGQVLRALDSIPGAADRPGMVELFRAVHAAGMRNAGDRAELCKVDTFDQLHAMVRAAAQPAFAAAIRDIWQPMQRWFDRGAMVIPTGKQVLRAPKAAETTVEEGIELAVLPVSSRFAELFETTTIEQTLALLKRCVERMGRHFIDRWRKSPAGQTREVKQAGRLLRTLRNIGFDEALANGFASGVSDVVNPLHALVGELLQQRRPAALTAESMQATLARHEDFSVFLATFSLPCLAALEEILRRPPSPATREFLRKWTTRSRGLSGSPRGSGSKGFPLDCDYDPRYFQVRSITDSSQNAVHVVDFDREAFSAAEIARIASRLVRLGCPSLGQPHRFFTRAMCQAYTAVVLPQMQDAGF